MIRGCDGIIRDERLQTANLLKIAFGQSATPVNDSFSCLGGKPHDFKGSDAYHS